MKLLPVVLSAAAALLSAHGLPAQPPRVRSLDPPDGATDVPPGPAWLRATFDTDMDTRVGWSVCGGGPTFPEVVATDWIDARTLEIQARLQPGQRYALTLNCTGSAQRLAALGGDRLAPTAWRFETADTAAELGPAAQRDRNESALDAAEAAIADHYSYRDRVVEDWQARFAAAREELLDAPDDRRFVRRLAEVLAAARDPHLWIGRGERRQPTWRADRFRNVDVSMLPRRVEDFEQLNQAVWTGRFSTATGGDIGYLALTTLDSSRTAEVRAGLAALDGFRDCRGLILDLRFNGGGDERLAQQYAARFADRPAVYARQLTRDPDTGRWDLESVRRLPVAEPAQRFTRPVVALIGGGVMSSAEGLVLMLRQCPDVTLVGAPTFGSSGNPRPRLLPNGYELWLPSWRALDAEGKMFEGFGIAPDVRVEASTAEDFADGDPVLARALEILQR